MNYRIENLSTSSRPQERHREQKGIFTSSHIWLGTRAESSKRALLTHGVVLLATFSNLIDNKKKK